jgi:hypothetical protein
MKDFELVIDTLKISFEVLEIDERMPSFKTKLLVQIIHPTGEFNYSGDDIWFECRSWDETMKKLNSSTENFQSIILGSMSENFQMVIDQDTIKIEITEATWNGFAVNLKHHRQISRDEFYIIKRSILALDAWW